MTRFSHSRLLLLFLSFLLMACSLLAPAAPAAQPPQVQVAPPVASPATAVPTLTPVPTLPPTMTPAPLAAISDRIIQEKNESPAYDINIHYPYMDGGEGLQTFNALVNDILYPAMEDIKQQAAEIEDWRKENLPEYFSTLIVDYQVLLDKENLMTVAFDISVYIAGAAHGVTVRVPLNYSLQEGRALELGELFAPDSAYLENIAEYCRKHVDSSLVMAPEGFDPLPENYAAWHITPEGLLVSFNPYQVSAYAVGRIDVTIPYAYLVSLVHKTSPLQRLLN